MKNTLRASRYFGRPLWRNWSEYHRPSHVETKMHCMKLLGLRLRARDFDRQVAKVQVRIAIQKCYTASASLLRKQWDRSGGGTRRTVHQLVCATEPHSVAKSIISHCRLFYYSNPHGILYHHGISTHWTSCYCRYIDWETCGRLGNSNRLHQYASCHTCRDPFEATVSEGRTAGDSR